MRTYPPEVIAVNQYYQAYSPCWRGRYETIKVVKTRRGMRMICIFHYLWPEQSTRCFSLSLRQLQARIESGMWVLDQALSDPALQVSEGL